MLGERVCRIRKLNIRTISYILLLLPVFKPYYFSTVDFLQTINLLYYLGAIGIMCVYSCTAIFYKLSRAITIPIFGICFMLFFATWQNGGELINSLLHIVTIVAMCLFAISCHAKGRDIWVDYLYALKVVLLLYFILNLLTMLLYPNGIPSISAGLRAQWLYGNDNGIVKLVVPGIFASLLLDIEGKSISFTSLFMIIASMCLYVFHQAYTALIVTMFILAWVIAERLLIKRVKVVLLCVVGFMLAFEIVVVIFGGTLGITDFIARLVGLDSTFSGRNYLWQRILLSFIGMPFWGYGVQDDRTMIRYIGNANGSHNYFLDTYYLCGIIGVVLLCYILTRILLSIIRVEKTNRSQYFACGILISYLIMFMFEPFYNSEPSLYPILLIVYLLFECKNISIQNNTK